MKTQGLSYCRQATMIWDTVSEYKNWLDQTESFGRAVAISADGSAVVVGAPEHRPYGAKSGASYVFTRPATGWGSVPEVATLTVSDGRSRDRFGYAVAISADGQTIAIGSTGRDDGLTSGATYVFTKLSGGWTDATETAKLTVAEGSEYEETGPSVAVSGEGDIIIVGALGRHS